jgi:hypothetical protein
MQSLLRSVAATEKRRLPSKWIMIMAGMTVRYDEVLGPLREAYDARAVWRDGQIKEPWKLAERQAFRERLA